MSFTVSELPEKAPASPQECQAQESPHGSNTEHSTSQLKSFHWVGAISCYSGHLFIWKISAACRVGELLNQRNHSRSRDLNSGNSADPSLPDTVAGLFGLTHGCVPAVLDHLRNTINFLSGVESCIF